MMKKINKIVEKNPAMSLVFANTALLLMFFALVAVYKEAEAEGITGLINMLKLFDFV